MLTPAQAQAAIRLPAEVKDSLGRLADATSPTGSFLAADATAREAAIIVGIDRGRADMKAGRLVPHDIAMSRLEATITAAAPKKR